MLTRVIPLHTNSQQDVLSWHFDAAQLRDPELVARMVQRIAVACDLRGDNTYLQLIVVELLNNAIDHGVLQLESKLKAEANGFTRYYKERERRLSDLRSGWIEVSIEVTANQTLCVRVLDSGNGFDYRALNGALRSGTRSTRGTEASSTVASAETEVDSRQRAENVNAADPFGRGLTILNDLCDTVAHVGCGNEVVVEIKLESLLNTCLLYTSPSPRDRG